MAGSVRVRPDPEAAAWLEAFEPVADGFDWDAGSRDKNERKHGVSDLEIERMAAYEANEFAGRIVEPDRGEWRGLLLSECDGRLLSLIFTIREERLRPICCRPMRHEERRRYAARKAQA